MTSLSYIFNRSRHILLYGALLAVLVFLLKWLQWKFLILDNSLDIYIGLIAVFFTLLGIWGATQLAKPGIQTIVVEKPVYTPSEAFVRDEAELEKLGLSKREFEVLQLLGKGHSNAQIARELCLSLSTVKTHASNLFVKMDVRSRTQAITRARELRIIG